MTSAIFITARLKSTRLKEKVLREICGKPMLYHMVERLKLAKLPSKIILCTSDVKQDDRLADYALSLGVEVFRGHPDDVLLRFTDAANLHSIDTIISCTADNPFVDSNYIDRLIEFHEDGGYDFSEIQGLPFGVFSYAISRVAAIKACKIKNEVDTEVWGGYFRDTGLFKNGKLVAQEPDYWPELRLTVDTKEDFALICEIFAALYDREGRVFSLNEIIELIRNNNSLQAINMNVEQKIGKPIRFKKTI